MYVVLNSYLLLCVRLGASVSSNSGGYVRANGRVCVRVLALRGCVVLLSLLLRLFRPQQ